MTDFDVIIIGARIAGSTLAGFLARQGRRILLLDQARFPRDTVSCAIAYAKALAIFDAIGAGAAVESLGAPPVRKIRKIATHRTIEGYLLPYQGRDYCYGLRRITLDDTLVRYVASLPGVTLREGFTVRDLIEEEGRILGVTGTSGGRQEAIRAPFVIGADGITSFVARRVGAPVCWTDPAEQCHYYAFYHDFESTTEPELLIHQATPDQSVISFPVDGDEEGPLLAVSWMPAAHRFESIRKDLDFAYDAAWHGIPELAERGRHARRASKIMGRAPTPTFARQPFGPGWALVGDAGFYTDPNGGRGFYDAVRGAELLAHAIDQIGRGRPFDEAMRVYHFARDFEYDPSYRFVRSMANRSPERSREEVELFALAQADPAFADCLLSVNHGIDVARFVGPPRLPFVHAGLEEIVA